MRDLRAGRSAQGPDCRGGREACACDDNQHDQSDSGQVAFDAGVQEAPDHDRDRRHAWRRGDIGCGKLAQPDRKRDRPGGQKRPECQRQDDAEELPRPVKAIERSRIEIVLREGSQERPKQKDRNRATSEKSGPCTIIAGES